jgi:predicted nucleic acid-binding protein
MVLVDTTVWIDFFAARTVPHVAALEQLIENDVDLCLCGVVLTEALQGIRSDSQFRKTSEYFDALTLLPMGQPTFVRAAEIYRSLRAKGVTIRKPIDCMIASVAIEHDVPLLHNDRDFDQIVMHTELNVVNMR